MAAEMTLNRTTQIAVVNGKAYRAYAWYSDDDKPFFFAVAGKTPLTLEDIGDEYHIIRQRPLYAAFRRAYFPFASQLVDELREKQPVAYCAVGLTDDAVKAAFIAQMEALAADPDRALLRARHIPDTTGNGPDALLIPVWRVPKRKGD
jgi:hypothetical protein